MANELIKKNFKDIANAIRAKTGENGLIKAEDMPAKIESIETGIEPEGTKEIVENAEQINVREFEFVDVAVPTGVFPEGNLNITENTPSGSSVDVTEKASVTVNVPVGVFPSGTLQISENAEGIDVTNYASVDVDVPGFVYTQWDGITYDIESGTSTIYLTTPDAIRLYLNPDTGIAKFDFQPGVVDPSRPVEYNDWGTSSASSSTTIILEGVLPGAISDYEVSMGSGELLQILLTYWEDVVISGNDTALERYNSLAGTSYSSFNDIEEPDESAVNSVGADCLKKWIVSATGNENSSVSFTVYFVDQMGRAICQKDYTLTKDSSDIQFSANAGGGC